MQNAAKRSSGRLARLLALGFTVALVGAIPAGGGVSPSSINQSANPGDTIGPITKTVTTPVIPPNPDIFFLADVTGSMGPAIANVKANATSVMNQVLAAQPSAQFGVGQYRDIFDPAPVNPYQLQQGITPNVAAAQAAINNWVAAGGGDTPEGQYPALYQVAFGTVWRPGSSRVVVWFGDAPGHDPRGGISKAQAISALQAEGIRVIAVSVTTGAGGLGTGGSDVTSATGGTFLNNVGPNDVANAILSGLQNLPATITHFSSCASGLSTSITPASITVPSGGTATFQETISVGGSAPQGSTLSCTVQFLINGGAAPEFLQTITVPINDVSPPVVSVSNETVEATSPAGAVVNYTATAFDNVDGPLTPSCSPASGSVFSIAPTLPGIHTVTCSATDSGGNTGTGTGTMTVVDTTPPVITVPANITEEATGPGGANVSYSVSATDIVDVTDPVSCSPASGSLFAIGTTTVNCTSTDLHGNSSSKSFTVKVQDTTAPSAGCSETNNPSGGNIPNAGPNAGKSGQNPDGFYRLSSRDAVDPNPKIYVVDTGTGTVFGPFANGTKIKYTEANGATPSQKVGAGDIDWHLKGQGDAGTYAVDSTGNRSATAMCLVPNPPK